MRDTVREFLYRTHFTVASLTSDSSSKSGFLNVMFNNILLDIPRRNSAIRLGKLG